MPLYIKYTQYSQKFYVFPDLARMYALVCLVPKGMDRLREVFQEHVHEQGLSVLERCKDTAINVIWYMYCAVVYMCDNCVCFYSGSSCICHSITRYS